MSRQRYRFSDNQSSLLSWDGWGLTPYTGPSVVEANQVPDSMTDRIDPYARNDYNAVSHITYDFAPFGPAELDIDEFRYPGDPPRQIPIIITRYNVMPGYIPACQDAYPWDDMIYALCDRVNGRLQARAQIGTSLYMLSKTYRMVCNPFGLLKVDWRRLAGDLTPAKLMKSGVNLWLEGRYGWRVAYKDTCSFFKAAGELERCTKPHLSELQDFRSFCVSRAIQNTVPDPSVSDSEWVRLTSDYNVRNASGFARIVWLGDTSYLCISTLADVMLQRHYNAIERFMQAYGCTFRDILPTVWNIIPYSFVVDWFVNSQKIFNGISAQSLPMEHVRKLGFSEKRILAFRAEFTPLLPYASYADGRSYANGLGSWYFSSKDGAVTLYSRTRGLPGSGEPLFSLKGLSVLHGIDGLTLAGQRLFH